MRNLMWSGIACLVFLGGAELAARHEGFGKPLIYRSGPSGYEMVPSQQINRLGRTMHINALGTRGNEVAPIPAKGTWRVMVLGDSVSNGGSQLSDAQTFPAVASRQLNGASCRSEILNASAGGWSLFDEANWIHAHGVAGAGMLVWTINSLDLDQPPSGSETLDYNPSFPSHAPTTALGEILFRYALPRLGLGSSAADSGSITNAKFDATQFVAVRALVNSVTHELAQRGIPVAILFHDTLAVQPPARVSGKAQFLAQLSAEGIPVLQTGLNRQRDAKDLFLDTIHPNARGDAQIGSDLAKFLGGRCPHSPT